MHACQRGICSVPGGQRKIKTKGQPAMRKHMAACPRRTRVRYGCEARAKKRPRPALLRAPPFVEPQRARNGMAYYVADAMEQSDTAPKENVRYDGPLYARSSLLTGSRYSAWTPQTITHRHLHTERETHAHTHTRTRTTTCITLSDSNPLPTRVPRRATRSEKCRLP